MRWNTISRILFMVMIGAPLGLIGVLILPSGDLILPIPSALFLALALVAGGYMSRALLDRPPARRCPQCNRVVPTGMLACGPCGYSFVSPHMSPLSPTDPEIVWPKSPVRLTPLAAQPAEQPAGPASPIPVPNTLQAPLLKRAKVAAPGRDTQDTQDAV